MREARRRTPANHEQVEITLESLRAPHENIVMPIIDAPSDTVCKGINRSVEASRQYSLEEEYLLSSRYPR